jgi:hypothetical protein
MSKTTIELRYIYPTKESFDSAMKNYPIFDENHRTELNYKIYEHYDHREIALETPALFKKFLDRRMREIMPLYNQRYSSIPEVLKVSPIENVNMTETFTHEVTDTGKTTNSDNSTSTNTLTNTGEGTNVISDTPQGEITEDDIKNNKYASQTSHSKDSGSNIENSTSTGSSEINNNGTRTETYTRKEFGSSKGYTFAQNIQQWRDIMLNIDMEIIEDLETVFYQLW